MGEQGVHAAYCIDFPQQGGLIMYDNEAFAARRATRDRIRNRAVSISDLTLKVAAIYPEEARMKESQKPTVAIFHCLLFSPSGARDMLVQPVSCGSRLCGEPSSFDGLPLATYRRESGNLLLNR